MGRSYSSLIVRKVERVYEVLPSEDEKTAVKAIMCMKGRNAHVYLQLSKNEVKN